MNIDPRQYATIYDQYRSVLLPGIRRTGANPADPIAATYAVSVTSFSPQTGSPLPTEVVGLNRVAVLAQISEWQSQIMGIQKMIDNTNLFLADADAALLA